MNIFEKKNIQRNFSEKFKSKTEFFAEKKTSKFKPKIF